MSEVKEVLRWQLKGFIPGVEGVSKAELKPWVVLASDYDALAQQLAAAQDTAMQDSANLMNHHVRVHKLEKQLAASEARCEEILEDFEILKGERESAGRQASAFEERMGEFQARCGKLESALEATKTVHKAAQKRAADASTQLAARDKQLADAVGLLRDLESVDSSEPYCPVCFNFIGCGHDIGCKLKAFLTTLEQDKENE